MSQCKGPEEAFAVRRASVCLLLIILCSPPSGMDSFWNIKTKIKIICVCVQYTCTWGIIDTSLSVYSSLLSTSLLPYSLSCLIAVRPHALTICNYGQEVLFAKIICLMNETLPCLVCCAKRDSVCFCGTTHEPDRITVAIRAFRVYLLRFIVKYVCGWKRDIRYTQRYFGCWVECGVFRLSSFEEQLKQ